jgi:hypothetical protein
MFLSMARTRDVCVPKRQIYARRKHCQRELRGKKPGSSLAGTPQPFAVAERSDAEFLQVDVVELGENCKVDVVLGKLLGLAVR